jgi:hypothetical protein
MKTSDFTKRPNSNSLNETLNKRFGEKLDIKNYTSEQLQKAASLIESKLAAYSKSKFNETLENEEFHRLKMMHDVIKAALTERAKSKDQQKAAGAAIAAKRGEAPKSKLKGASKEMCKMPEKELKKFAGTKHKGLPKKVSEGIIGTALKGAAGAGLGYVATGSPLGALAGGYLGSQIEEGKLDEVSELAWENARSYVRSMKRGMLEQSKHYKEACRNWGGKIWHDDIGECWMSHSGINEGQPFRVVGMDIGGKETDEAVDFATMASGLGNSIKDLGAKAGSSLATALNPVASPDTAASIASRGAKIGANAALPVAAGLGGVAAGSMMGGSDKDESITDEDLATTLQGWGSDAARSVATGAAKLAPNLARKVAGDPSAFGFEPTDADIASGFGDTAAEFGKKAAIPVALGGAGLAGLAAGSMMNRKKDDDTDEGIVSGVKKIYKTGKQALGGTVGALGGHQVGKFVGGLAGKPELGGLAGAGLGALAGVDAVDEEMLSKKDYDGDGEIESPDDEWKGSRDKAIKKAIAMKESIYRMLREGEEGKAEIIMAVKNMVDKFTGWSEDIAQMQAQTAMEMADSIRDEMGSDMAEQFTAAVQPALASAFENVKSARETLSNTVGTLTGEAPTPMGAPAGAGMDPMAGMGGMEMPPADEEEPVELSPDEPPPEGRAKRESIERTLRVTRILAGR